MSLCRIYALAIYEIVAVFSKDELICVFARAFSLNCVRKGRDFKLSLELETEREVKMGRIIGIRHRTKRTKEGEARPTLLAIKDGDRVREIKLKEDDDELDFANGCLPIKWRKRKDSYEDISKYNPRHCKWGTIKDPDENDIIGISKLHKSQVRINAKGQHEVATKVPTAFDGFKSGDTAVMILGGSGDLFLAKLSHIAQEIKAKVFSIPGVSLKEYRGEKADEDHAKIIELFEKSSNAFYLMRPRDVAVIRVKEALKIREDAQDERIKCEQRMYQRARIIAFIDEKEGSIRDAYASLQANDEIYKNLLEEEKRCEKELKNAVQALDVWKEVFAEIKGCGEIIAAKIIAPIGDIRRFPTVSKFKKFCGVHVMPDGTFPRKRRGHKNDNGKFPRDALWWLVREQFVKNNNPKWRPVLDHYIEVFRGKHPKESGNNGKSKYSDAHIRKMATWRTCTKFTEWLYENLQRTWGGIETN